MTVSEAHKTPVWVWVTLGLIIGLFVAFILFLDQNIVKNAHKDTTVTPETAIGSRPVFDFYKVLPERKMEIPDTAIASPNAGSAAPRKNGLKNSFMVQAGSFLRMQDAERHKAELTLLGFEPKIKTAAVSGTTYYRIELGPFNESEYSKVQRSLIENDIVYFAKKL